MTIIAYARFSSAAQAEGMSLERQFDAADAYAKARGWTINERLSDEGLSAFHGHHRAGQLGEIFKRIHRGQLGAGDIILVENIDRLSREKITDAMFSMMTMMTAGLTVITTDDGRVLTKDNYDTQTGDMFDTLIKVRLANEESEKKRTRTNALWNKLHADGVLTLRNPFWLDKKKNPRPDKVAIVQMVFDLADQGQGAQRIANHLNQLGVKSAGKSQSVKNARAAYSSASVSKLLRNRSVLGEYQGFKDGEPVGPVVLDYFPQIISHDQFNRVNAMIATRKFGAEGSGRHTGDGNIFRGIAKCSQCGERMVLSSVNKRRYLQCRLAKAGGCAANRLWVSEVIEESFMKAIKEIVVSTGTPSWMTEKREEHARLLNQIETTKANNQTIFKLLEKRPDSETILSQLDESEASLKRMRARLVEVEAEISQMVPPDRVHSEALTLWSAFDQTEDKRAFREQMNVVMKRLIRRMTISSVGSLVFQLQDMTTYTLQFEEKPNLVGKKRKITDFQWRLAGRASIEDIAAAWADQEAALDAAIAEAMKQTG